MIIPDKLLFVGAQPRVEGGFEVAVFRGIRLVAVRRVRHSTVSLHRDTVVKFLFLSLVIHERF